jgi:hypothetical protein
MPAPVQVEPPWMRIDLDHDVVLRTSTKYLLDIDFVSRSALKLASGHVTDDHREGISDGAQQALGLGLPIHFEPAMNAGDHEVESGRHIVGIVQRPVSQYVGLIPFRIRKSFPNFLLRRSASRCCCSICSMESPPAQYADLEWSAIPKYSKPRSRVALAILSSVSVPSDASVWQCRIPRRSSSVTSFGSFLLSARSISPRPSRNSGSMNGRPRAA